MAMAAGMAEVGSEVVPACYIVVSLIFCGHRSSTHDHGVQTSTGEARGARELLGVGEEVLKVGLGHGRVVGVGSTVVEAFESGSRGRRGHG